MSGFDVAVVGAGVVGAAVAYECARRGAGVVLLERGRPGGQASGAAAGMLAPGSEAHRPGAFLELGQRSLGMWPGLAAAVEEETGASCELRLDGLLHLALEADDTTELRRHLAWQRDLGVEARWLGAAEVAAQEPGVAAVHGAVWYPGEGHVHSPRAVAALVAAMERRGGSLRCGAEVCGLAPGGRLRLGGGGAVEAAAVVLCAGSWSAALARDLGAAPLPVRPVRGQLVALDGLRPAPRAVLYGGPAGYAVAKRDGQVLVGATEDEAGHDAAVTAAATERLLTTAKRLLRGAGQARLGGAWAGLRPATPDGLPLLGELAAPPGGPRLLVATGHYRNGVLLAPVSAALLADLALEGSVDPALAAFSPDRFA